MKKINKTNKLIAMQTARNSIIINVGLAAFKLFAGIFAHSAAMIADAVHSITDLIGTVIVIIGIKLANKKSDKNHQYGHERFESMATLALAMLILVVGIGIGWNGIQTIIFGNFEEIIIPGLLALVAAFVSIFVKEAVYWYVRGVAEKIDSSALMADAWHSRVDGLTSIGSLIGVLGARLTFPILDSIAAFVISIFIIKTAIKVALDATKCLIDEACDEETVNEIFNSILTNKSVIRIDQLKTRIFGNRIYVDIEIAVSSLVTFKEAHNISHQVQNAVENQFPKVKHCKIHVNPMDENLD